LLQRIAGLIGQINAPLRCAVVLGRRLCQELMECIGGNPETIEHGAGHAFALASKGI
jgi:hypothetical protein